MAPARTPRADVPKDQRRHSARGLCTMCYHWVKVHGGLINYERFQLTWTETREEYERLPSNISRREAAARIGVSYKALNVALRSTNA